MEIGNRVRVTDIFCLAFGYTGVIILKNGGDITVMADGDLGNFIFIEEALEVIDDDAV